MSNEEKTRQPTAAEVDAQKQLAQRDMQAYQAQEAQAQQKQQQQQTPPTQQQQAEAVGQGTEGIIKVTLKTQFINIEITDPNILAEFNTPDKYAQNLPFMGLEFNINPQGARLVVKTEDKKEVLRDAMSGVKRTETQEIKYWSVERGPNAPLPQPTQ